jgi:hypothetical protein
MIWRRVVLEQRGVRILLTLNINPDGAYCQKLRKFIAAEAMRRHLMNCLGQERAKVFRPASRRRREASSKSLPPEFIPGVRGSGRHGRAGTMAGANISHRFRQGPSRYGCFSGRLSFASGFAPLPMGRGRGAVCYIVEC